MMKAKTDTKLMVKGVSAKTATPPSIATGSPTATQNATRDSNTRNNRINTSVRPTKALSIRMPTRSAKLLASSSNITAPPIGISASISLTSAPTLSETSAGVALPEAKMFR